MKKIFTLVLAILALAGCMKDSKISVYASFSTEKDVYEVNEDISVTNTSYAENGRITACKWECGSTIVWSLQPDTKFSFASAGEYDITLTAIVYTDKGNVTGTYTKTITVQDTNVRPIVDFDWSPKEGIIAGDPVQFTDKSSDPDGQIVAWEWKFGSTIVTEQNPAHCFAEFGKVDVTLKVTDNQKGVSSKTVTIEVEKNIYSLEKIWSQTFETDSEAFVKVTSPSLSPDGKTVYAFSSGYHLAAFDAATGNVKWKFDATKHNPSPFDKSNPPTKRTSSSCPAVDAEGNVFVVVGYNEASSTSYESGLYCVAPDGSEKWYFGYGNARYVNVTPLIVGDHIFLTSKSNPTKANYPDLWSQLGDQDNGQVVSRTTGQFVQRLLVKRGTYGGGLVGLKSGAMTTHCDDAYGGRLFFLENGTWKHYGDNDTHAATGVKKSLGYGNESGETSEMAIDKDQRLYVLYASKYGKVSTPSALYCYDLKKFVRDADTAFEPEWICGINGANSRYYSDGIVIGEDGTIYVATSKSGDNPARITAVTPSGEVKWESLAGGNIAGTPAIDNNGFIYYNDMTLGKIVMLDPADGSKKSETSVCDGDLRSSPTIAPDGTIYCLGMNSGTPTLVALRGNATGHANSWSQLRGNPQKSGVLY